MDKAQVVKKLKKYKKLLSQHMVFEDIVLYGSYAKGHAHDDSDFLSEIMKNGIKI